MIFSEKITELRKRSGLSQEQFGDKIGVSRQAVSKWEMAQSVPDINKVMLMADFFGVTADYLLGRDQEPAQEWNAQYPGGVALRRDMSGYKSESRPAPQGLTMEDLAKIAEYVNNAKPNDAPKTPEARIVSYGMDNLPQEIRERILNIVLATVKGTPEEKYFKEDANK